MESATKRPKIVDFDFKTKKDKEIIEKAKVLSMLLMTRFHWN